MPLTAKKSLATSLKNMLSKKTLDKITVKEIVDDCNLNRQTFYYHFHDTYALLEWMYLNEAKDIVDDLNDPINQTSKYKLILDFIINNRTLILNTYHSLDLNFLEQKLKSFIKPIIIRVGSSIAPNAANEEIEFSAEVYTYSLLGLCIEWANRGLPEDYIPNFFKLGRLICDAMKALS